MNTIPASKLDDVLMKSAVDFREGILAGRSSEGYCFMVCAPLEGYLHFLGIDAEMVEGIVSLDNDEWEIEHCWLCLPDGRVLDPTADQFENYELPEVYLGVPHKDVHHLEIP